MRRTRFSQSEGELDLVSSAGRHPPAIAGRIMEAADAVAPGLLSRCKDWRRARGRRSIEDGIHILDVCEVDAWASWVCRTRFAQHHDRVADLNLGVLHSALGRDLPLAAFDRAEHVVEKTDQPFDSFDDDVWIDTVIAVWRRGANGHEPPLPTCHRIRIALYEQAAARGRQLTTCSGVIPNTPAQPNPLGRCIPR
jgi:hypothetical protein